jgi:hypothetical protein
LHRDPDAITNDPDITLTIRHAQRFYTGLRELHMLTFPSRGPLGAREKRAENEDRHDRNATIPALLSVPAIKQACRLIPNGFIHGRIQMSVPFPRLPAAVVLLLLLGGCFNMPTPSSQITAAPGAGLKYEGEEYTCPRLSAELETLARRELQLIAAQERRVKSSNVQALVLGFGQGDGTEAAELATVRGDEGSVIKAMDAKQCGK